MASSYLGKTARKAFRDRLRQAPTTSPQMKELLEQLEDSVVWSSSSCSSSSRSSSSSSSSSKGP